MLYLSSKYFMANAVTGTVTSLAIASVLTFLARLFAGRRFMRKLRDEGLVRTCRRLLPDFEYLQPTMYSRCLLTALSSAISLLLCFCFLSFPAMPMPSMFQTKFGGTIQIWVRIT